MKQLLILSAVMVAFLLIGCEERYRYPCQDEANKDNPECTRPACETDGMCYDTLNGLTSTVEESSPTEDGCNCNDENVESTGE